MERAEYSVKHNIIFGNMPIQANRSQLYSLYSACLDACYYNKMNERCEYAVAFLQQTIGNSVANKDCVCEQIDDLLDELNNFFLNQETKSLLAKGLASVKNTVTTLFSLCTQPSPTWTDLCDASQAYLDSYFLLQRDTLTYWESLQPSAPYRHFIYNLLHLGCIAPSTLCTQEVLGCVGEMTPLAPNYTAAIWELARQMFKFHHNNEATSNDGSIFSDMQFATQKEILFLKLCRYMRWFMPLPEGVLCHVALRSYTEDGFSKESINLPIRRLQSYSSFEGINELRLFEKIQYELEKMGPEKNRDFVISVLGDLSYKQIYRLQKMLHGWIKDEESDIRWTNRSELRIQIHIYTRNPLIADNSVKNNNDIFDVKYIEDLPLDKPDRLATLFFKSDLLFFLDCRELYSELACTPYPELSSFLQSVSSESYHSIQAFLDKTDATLSPASKYFDMQNLLIGAVYGGREPALLSKKINKVLFDFIESQTEQRAASVYLYFSDLSAVQEIYWLKDRLVRIERHSGKEFAILRLGKFDERNLTVLPPSSSSSSRSSKIIAFNLWQFIKHISLSCANDFVNKFGFQQGEMQYYHFCRVMIGIDYSEWPKTLRISYYYNKESQAFPDGFQRKLQMYIEKCIMPCLHPRSEDIFQQYIRQCISSFLYSDARNVDDMLFLHLFSKMFKHIKNVMWAESPFSIELKQYCASSCLKYSDKRFYQEIFADYDAPRLYFANQFIKLDKIRNSTVSVPADYFTSISEVCRNNHYIDSDLYRNCLEMLEKT